MMKALLALGVVACVLGAGSLHAEEHRLTLHDAVALALQRNSEIAAGKAGIGQADAARKRAFGHFFPVVKAEANVMVWDSVLKLNLGSSGNASALAQLPAPQTPYEMAFSEMLKGFSSMPDLRDQVTGQITLTLAQPLTPLWQVTLGHKAQKIGVDVAQQQLQKSERSVALGAAVSYLRLLQAMAMAQTADKFVEQLHAQVSRLESLVRHNVAAKADLLKVQVVLAAAQQGALRAHTGVELARSALAVAIGLPIGDTVTPAESGEPQLPPTISLTPEQAFQMALERRPELRELRLRLEQTRLAKKVAVANMIPAVSAVATYQHSEGSGLSDPDSFFAGLFFSWNVFEWGSTYYGIDEAEAQTRQVENMAHRVESLVYLEVKKALLDLQTSIEALTMAKAAIVQAEEALRVETKRFTEGANTNTDVLDATTALTQARDNLTASLYEVLVAHTTFRIAIGESLADAPKTTGGLHE